MNTCQRTAAINNLKDAVNSLFSTELTFAQVECWVGSDATTLLILAETQDVLNGKGVTPSDILELQDVV